MKLRDKEKLINHLTQGEKHVLRFHQLDIRNYVVFDKGADYIKFKSLENGQVINLRR